MVEAGLLELLVQGLVLQGQFLELLCLPLCDVII